MSDDAAHPSASVIDAVHADLEARRTLGRQQYGDELRFGTPVDMLDEAYGEALDLPIYLRAAIEQVERLRAENAALQATADALAEIAAAALAEQDLDARAVQSLWTSWNTLRTQADALAAALEECVDMLMVLTGANAVVAKQALQSYRSRQQHPAGAGEGGA